MIMTMAMNQFVSTFTRKLKVFIKGFLRLWKFQFFHGQNGLMSGYLKRGKFHSVWLKTGKRFISHRV